MSDTPATPIHKAHQAEAAGDFAAADGFYHAAYSPQAPDPALLMGWAALRRRMGDMESAARMFDLAGRAGAGPLALVELAGLALDRNQPDEAAPLLQQALKHGRGPAVDYQMARWEAAHRRYQQAATGCCCSPTD
jgi:tetratricopeptide (TPR) repeat protein